MVSTLSVHVMKHVIEIKLTLKLYLKHLIGDAKTGFATECFWVNKALKTNDNTKQMREQTHGSILTARVCAIRHVHVPDQRGLHSEPQDTMTKVTLRQTSGFQRSTQLQQKSYRVM